MMRVLLFLLAGQSAPGVDDQKVQDAIKKGVVFLRSAPNWGENKKGVRNCDELILLALIHAGVGMDDPKVKEILGRVLSGPIDRTYGASLQAVVLEEIDRVRFQWRIAQCGQFLIDNQCTNGQWSYGDVTPAIAGMNGPDKAGGDVVLRRPKPKVEKKLPITRTRTGPASGDNSNSQYAALGIRACVDSGVVIPQDVLHLAAKSFREGPGIKEDWKGPPPKGVPSGAVPRGWCYHSPNVHRAYMSMTAGSMASLTIYDALLKKEWKKDAVVNEGLAWMASRFSVTENAGPMEWEVLPENYLYYALYAMERAGRLYGTEYFGERSWYSEGVKFLLDGQNANGSWGEKPAEKSWSIPTWDTCFAILFLKRATAPLVPSVDKFLAPK